MFEWILGIRRAVCTLHNRSPVPGSITLLAPHYKQGMERMYSDLARATRFVKPEPTDAEDIGSAEVAKQMNQGVSGPSRTRGLRRASLRLR